jgi:hypothetical protein
MGLDMLPLARPHRGHEAEFEELWTAFQIVTANMRPSTPTAPRSFWARLTGAGPPQPESRTPEDLLRAIQAISDEVFTTLGAPVVGVDQAANDWLTARVERGEFGANADGSMIQRQMRGYHAIELLPECDGFPVYSNHFLSGARVDRTSFRGEFLRDCSDVLDEVDIARAWTPMLARDLSVYGKELRAAAEAVASRQRLSDLLGLRTAPDAPERSLASQVHIADSCGRWCIYWAERGHGLSPDY